MFIIKLFSRFPLSILYGVSDFLFILSYYFFRYRRKVVIKNLKAAFPDKTDEEILAVARKFYSNLCDFAVETLKTYSISKDELVKRVKFYFPHDFEFEKEPIIGLASHQFNWEWLMLSGCIQLNMGMDFVYQPLKNKTFNDFMLHLRSRFGAYPVKRSEVGRVAIKRREELRIIALVADQFPSRKSDKRFWTNFLGQETAFYQGIEQLALLTQYPVYHFSLRKVKRGYYSCEIKRIVDPPYHNETPHIVDAYVKATEAIIREEPQGWLWSHDRWKRSKNEMGD